MTKKKVFNVRISEDLYAQFKEKLGLLAMSVVIRRLIEKYIKGEITLD